LARKKQAIYRNLYAVIMAGGKGTRFWPLSRESFPKQFLKLVGDKTLLQDTIHRLEGQVSPDNIVVVTTKGQKDIVDWQVGEILNDVNSIVEPEGKNTAPAIALVAFKLFKKNKKAMMLVLPSDHMLTGTESFRAALEKAVAYAEKGKIVTFGVRPAKPETAYGYIKAGRRLSGGVFNVSAFVEKPDLKTARGYLKDGGYYWNSGMFLFRVGDMLEEIRKYMPETHGAFDAVIPALNTKREESALSDMYGSLINESIDYGVMEKSRKVAMVEAGFEWSDIGSWNALEEVMEGDKNGNVVIGNVVGMDCKGSIFYTGEKLLGAIGVRDMVVVNTSDATLIVPKSKVQKVKDLVETLKKEGKEEYLTPSIEDRPWGNFSVLEEGPTHKIKHIYLKPGARLSLQSHNHRSEHWIVVSGTAKVQKGEDVSFVHQNESTYIPATVRHRLENPGIIPLRIVEIQSGEYLGEDDIIRFDDIYGRSTGK
jgi:mannose-1-phosphate guanylyltransferase/mannose-6-phosphate isomerase